MKLIARINIGKTAKLLKEQGYVLEISDLALEKLGEEGFDPVYGARPLRRLIQNAIENPISLKIIGQEFVAGDTIKVDYDTAKSEYSFLRVAAQPATPAQAAPNDPNAPQPTGTPPAPNGAQAAPVQPAQNGMIVDPYTPIKNPMAPEPFSPFAADQNAQAPAAPQPTVGNDGTQMQPA